MGKMSKSCLETPFGEIIVEVNGYRCDYDFEKLPIEKIGQKGFPMFKVDGRYRIKPRFTEPVAFPMRVKCRVDSAIEFDERSELETGERYSAASMYHNNIKMCIGSYDGIDEMFKQCNGFPKIIGGLILNDYTTSGIEIYVKELAYLKEAYFCTAWASLSVDDSRDVENEVWFAAEPCLSEVNP